MPTEIVPSNASLILGPVGQLPETPEAGEFGFVDDILPAAFNQENIIGSFLSEEEGVPDKYQLLDQGDFDPIAAISGTDYEINAANFIYATNEEHVEIIKRQIDNEKNDRKILADSGALGFIGSMVAGVFDPINFIPVGGAAYKTYRVGGSILENGFTTARAGMLSMTASEAALHQTQQLRTFGESATNVAVGTMFAGLLGGSIGGFKTWADNVYGAKAIDELKARTEKDMDVSPPDQADIVEPHNVNRSAGAAAVKRTEGDDKVFDDLKILEKFKWMAPTTRTLFSPLAATRDIAQRLVANPFILGKNKYGQDSAQSAEMASKFWQAGLYRGTKNLDDQFVKYRLNRESKRFDIAAIGVRDVLGKDKTGKLTKQQFNEEVGKAMRNGDQHELPEIANAAQTYRKEVFDPLAKEAIDLELLPQEILDLGPATAKSYLNRVYNREKLVADPRAFEDITFKWLKAEDEIKVKAGKLKQVRNDAELTDVAKQIRERIISTPLGRLPYDAYSPSHQSKSSTAFSPNTVTPLNARAFLIPDNLIEDYLEQDIEQLARVYSNSLAVDVEITRSFGSLDFTDPLKEMQQELRDKLTKIKTPKAREKLQKQFEDDQRDLIAMRDRMRGTYKTPDNPEALLSKTGRTVRDLNYLRLLGGMTVSAVTDPFRIAMMHGMGRMFGDGIIPLMTNIKKFKIAAEEVRYMGNALDNVLDTRSRAIADISDDYGRGSKLERGLKGLTNKFGVVSLMAPWNSMWKEVTGVATINRVMDGLSAIQKGTISPKELEFLNFVGVGKNQDILEQFNKFGNKDKDFYYLNTTSWKNQEAAREMANAINLVVDQTIVTPGQEIPLMFSSEMGKVFFQFKSFVASSTQKVTLAGLQRRDANTLSGLVGMVSMGMMAYAFKQWDAGRDISDDPRVWIREGVDRSGAFGWFTEANASLEKMSRGKLGVGALLGAEQPVSRFASRSQLDTILGPTFGSTAELSLRILSGGLSGDWTQQDTRAMRRLLPYQNLMFFRQGVDQVENSINESLGIPKSNK